MNQFIKSTVTLWMFFMMTACTLIGVQEWNAYKVIVEVKNTAGELVQDADVTSAADDIEQEKPGVYSLLYGQTGLHVVTISAPDKQTKQIKVSLPTDEKKIFTVILNDK